MSALIRAWIAIVLASAAPALADGATRVVLADADPELERAVRATLAPWKLEVVVDPRAPTTEDHAQIRGSGPTARFVVWRENGELVVLDRERGATEHREAPSGPLDPASAAAAALTVKTLMRLPPPEHVAEAVDERRDQIEPGAPPPSAGVGLRVQATFASRMTRGLDTDFGARASLSATLRPVMSALRVGIAGELGTAIDVQHAGFKGTWRDWSVLALASWTFAISGRWELEPFIGIGVVRSKLDGTEGMMERHERETLALTRGGVVVRVRTGRYSVGGAIAFDATAGTPTYTRSGMGSQFFEVPPFALSIGVTLAADLTR
jgi:hypothetical protein